MTIATRIRNRIHRIFSKPQQPLNYEAKLSIILGFANQYKTTVLIETGTLLGDTVEFFKTRMEKVISIELAEDLALKAQKRFANDSNVTIIQGDSGVVLQSLVKEFKQPILFWLDGHYSSEFQAGDEYIVTAKAAIETPIIEEVKSILTQEIDHVILVDDARLFNGQCDYPTVGEFKRLIKKLRPDYSVEVAGDIIRVFPPLH